MKITRIKEKNRLHTFKDSTIMLILLFIMDIGPNRGNALI